MTGEEKIEWGEYDNGIMKESVVMNEALGRGKFWGPYRTNTKAISMTQAKKQFNLTNNEFVPPLMPRPINPSEEPNKWLWDVNHVELYVWRKSGQNAERFKELTEGKVIQKRKLSDMPVATSSSESPKKKAKKSFKVHHQIVFETGDWSRIEDDLEDGDWDRWEIAPVKKWFKQMVAFAKKKAKEESGVLEPTPSYEEAVKAGLKKLDELWKKYSYEAIAAEEARKEKEEKEKEDGKEEKEEPKKGPEPVVEHKIDERGKEVWTVIIDDIEMCIEDFTRQSPSKQEDESLLETSKQRTIIQFWIT